MNTNIDLLGLSDTNYIYNPFETKCELNIWDIENNEKEQLIMHIDNIISTKFEKKILDQNKIISAKFEKKILDQNKIIDELKKENIISKETINNLLFDLANCGAFGTVKTQYYLNKYDKNMLEVNQPLELEYIDYSFVSDELERHYIKTGSNGGHTSKNVSKSDMEFHIKKITLNIHQLKNFEVSNKIFKNIAPHIFTPYFKQFVKNINTRREYFQYDRLSNFTLMIYIMDRNMESSIKHSNPDIKFNFIPNFP
jgi:hypothetical protein